MNAAWTLLTAPQTEPISVDDAKLHLKVETTTEDVQLVMTIRAARAAVEEYLGRALITQTWVYTQDRWSDDIRLPRAAPLVSVTSVKYRDEAGTQQTLTSSVYLVDTASEPGRVLLAPTQSWPALQSGRPGAVEITYVAGWTTASLVPDPIRWAILLKIGGFHAFREDRAGLNEVAHPSGAVEALLAPYRVYWRPPC
jgi:uncharacterized phiE125 gp8 family phage protein